MRWRAIVALILVTTSAGAAIAAWQVRDPNTQTIAAAATAGIVTGVVLSDAADPQPVRRATVRLSGVGSTARIVGTDDEGRFVFERLPAGRMTLSASKVGFVQTFHGSTRPGLGPGVPLAVADGRTVDVTIKLLPGGVITGLVTDGRGNPAAGISVAAVDTRPAGGVTPRPARSVTDDRGAYRIFGLAPGDYLVSALPQLVPASDGRGRMSGATVTAVTEADVERARNPDAAAAAGGLSRPARHVAYAPVFYPGTTDAAEAATVRVTSGNERVGVDMSLVIVPLSGLGGTLVDARGQPLSGATVSLVPKRGDQPSRVDALVTSGALTLPRAIVSGSSFSFTGVVPGHYTLVARTGSGQRGAVAVEAGLPTLWSVTDLTVDGADRNDLALRLLPGMTITGRYAFEPGAASPVDPAMLNLSFVATDPIAGVSSIFRAAVQPDGTFKVPGVAAIPGSPRRAGLDGWRRLDVEVRDRQRFRYRRPFACRRGRR